MTRWYPIECEHGYDACPICDAPSLVRVRHGVTFARLVHETIGDPRDRSYTGWTPSRHMLDHWRAILSDWAGHRLVYIERCRLRARETQKPVDGSNKET